MQLTIENQKLEETLFNILPVQELSFSRYKILEKGILLSHLYSALGTVSIA